jgi:NADPH2:quinone reductase
VCEIGEGVEGFRVGEPVVSMSQATLGGYASVTLAQTSTVIPLGDSGVDCAQAVAALPLPTWA